MNTSIDDDREFNPYAPPKARLDQDTVSDAWSAEPRRVPAVNGLLWLRHAARVFAARPGLWATALALTTAVPTVLVLALIFDDLDGDGDEEQIAFMLLHLFWIFWPVLTGGIVNAAHKQLQGEKIRLRDIFAFFRSGVLFVCWSCVGFFVSCLMILVFGLLLVALEALPLTSAATAFLALALAVFLVTGNMFIAVAAALHGEWPLRTIFRAGLVNMPAFLLNLPAVTLAFWAVGCVGGFIETLSPGLPGLMPLMMAPQYVLFFVFALVAYAAVRDIFYNEE